MQSFTPILMQLPMAAYIGGILFLLWISSFWNFSSFWLFAMAFLFLIEVERNQVRKLRREIRNEERRSASQARPLSDFEYAEWINQALEKIWPLLEEFISDEILKPMVPWFIEKYKPWTVRKATLQQLKLGREPPKFRGVRTLQHTSGEDHLVMDFCLDFAAAEDMLAVLSVQVRRRLGLGITTNIHISRLQIEGKVRIGVKFSNSWPFITHARLCFESPPYVQMNARPISTHSVNVSELPLIAGWIERMIADVFEKSLVEPNMLVVDIEKLVKCKTTSQTPNSLMLDECLHVQEMAAIATLKVNILEASDLKPSDMNGLADPYVKGSFATNSFKTKVQRKTLKPRWYEEFELPIFNWELASLLVLRVRDKDQFRDDDLGFCELDISQFRDGQLHDLWIPLQDVRMGRLHVTISIPEVSNSPSSDCQAESKVDDIREDKSSLMTEKFEVINLGKGEDGGYLSIVSPGQALRTKNWHQRQGIRRHDTATNQKETLLTLQQDTLASSSSEESDKEETANAKPRKHRLWGQGWPHRRSSLISAKDEHPSLEDSTENQDVRTKRTAVKMKVEMSNMGGVKDCNDEPTIVADTKRYHEANAVSPSKRDHVKSMAKGLFKQAEKTAHHLSASFKQKGSMSKKAENEDVNDSAVPGTPDGESPKPLVMDTQLPVDSGRGSISSGDSHSHDNHHVLGGSDKEMTASRAQNEEMNESRGSLPRTLQKETSLPENSNPAIESAADKSQDTTDLASTPL